MSIHIQIYHNLTGLHIKLIEGKCSVHIQIYMYIYNITGLHMKLIEGKFSKHIQIYRIPYGIAYEVEYITICNQSRKPSGNNPCRFRR